MPLVDLHAIPGLDDAIERQDLVRDVSFLGVPETICGIQVLPMTPRHLLWLQIIQSPFIGAGVYELETLSLAVAGFFKTIAPLEKPTFMLVGKSSELEKFIAEVGQLKAPDAIQGIRDYVSETFMDSPGEGEGNSASYYSVGAAMLNRLCGKYGALNPNPMVYPSAIDLPLKCIFQLLKCMKRDEDPKAILFNGLSDRAKSVWINSQNRN